MRKIGLFGGAFNPPHKEHKAILECAKEELGLDFCVVFPSFLPPHKRTADSIPFDLRLKMCQKAFPRDAVSCIERESKEKNYAVNTVKKFQDFYYDDKLVYLIGGDSMADIFKWYEPEKLFKMVDIAVYPREGREADMQESIVKARKMGANIHVLSYKGENISSGEIRCLSALSLDVSEYVDEGVVSLFGDSYKSDLVEVVKSRLSERTYAHVVRTVKWALRLNRKLSLPVEDVFKAALLHDVTKNDTSFDGVPEDAYNTPVAHQFSGAKVAKDLGCNDSVVNAVKYHTTGKEDMTLLEKLIYSADMTEEGRAYPGVEKLREALLHDFEKGFVMCLKRSYDFLNEKGGNIYFLTKNAYEYYKNR